MIEVIKFPSKWRNKLFDPTHFSLKCKCPNCGSKVRISHIYDLQYDKEKCISYICPYCDANYPTHSCIMFVNAERTPALLKISQYLLFKNPAFINNMSS